MTEDGPDRPLILLTNDDGIASPGLRAIYDAMTAFADVAVVAPGDERSGVSHAITLSQPLRVFPSEEEHGLPGYVVFGTPADCVKLALRRLLPRMPDLVVSGINRGNNAGALIHYSGTVSGAREAVLMGVPSVALSLNQFHRPDYRVAARVGAEVCRRLVEGAVTMKAGTYLNVNVPGLPAEKIRGTRITRHAGLAGISDDYEGRDDPRGNRYYWLIGKFAFESHEEETDVGALEAGYVSITPLSVELTCPHHHEKLGGGATDASSPFEDLLGGGA